MKKYILGFGVVLKAKVHIFSIVPSPHPPPPSSFLPLWSFLKMICNCFIPVLCGHWSDHVLGWWRHRDDPNVLFLKYKDLIRLDCFIVLYKIPFSHFFIQQPNYSRLISDSVRLYFIITTGWDLPVLSQRCLLTRWFLQKQLLACQRLFLSYTFKS